MHKHCKHNLKLCEICNTVYCTKCGQEWKQYLQNTVFYPNYWYTISGTETSTAICTHVT